MRLVSGVQQIHDSLSEQDRKLFDALVSIAEEVDPSFQNRVQWQKPTFTLNDNWHHWIFSLDKTKAGMTLTFHKGWLLDDPQKILSGDGKHLRMLRFKDVAQIQKKAVKDLIHEAIRCQLDL
jgi:hypothetical protein